MKRNKTMIIIFSFTFFILPFIHIFLYSIISPIVSNNIYNSLINILYAIKINSKFNNPFFILWIIELLIFSLIGFSILFFKKIPYYMTVLLYSISLIIINLVSLFFYRGVNYSWYAISFIFLIYPLIISGILILTSIRKIPYFLNKIKALRPFFRHRCYFDVQLNYKKDKFNGKLVNLSCKGVFILTNMKIQLDDEYDISFKLNDKLLNARIKILRIIKDTLPYHNGFGAKIIKINDKMKNILRDFLLENDDMQVYKPRIKIKNIYFNISSDEGNIVYPIYDINKKGAFVISKDNWKINDVINGDIVIKDQRFKFSGKIVRINNKNDFSYPQGFAIVFDNYSKELKKILPV